MSKKILIVEDSKMQRMLLEAIFDKTDYQVDCCEDGPTAWNYINANDGPSLVLLDLHLPDIDGFQLLEHLRNKISWKQTPVMITSSSKDRDTVVAAIKSGANGFLSKPFQEEVILAKAGELLNATI